ncbi:MAG: Ig-like domain-containing protein [Spirochaetaceae bacterium]|nr:Ig-like domain-containing protein [Spirochaetaceae bacterium]
MGRLKALPLAAALLAGAFWLSTCSNPVDLVKEIEEKVMQANDRYLEVVSISIPKDGANRFSPTGSMDIAFDRPIDLSTVSTGTVVIHKESGSDVDYPPEGVTYLGASNTLRIRVLPFLDVNADFTLRVSGVKGEDGSGMLDGRSEAFKTKDILAGAITQLASTDVSSAAGYTKAATVNMSLVASTNYTRIRYKISDDGAAWSTETVVDPYSGAAIPVNSVDLSAAPYSAVDGPVELRVQFEGWNATLSSWETGMLAAASITMDRVPPTAPTTPDLLASDDTGSSSTDNITLLAGGLSLSGTGEVGTTVFIKSGVTSLGSAAVAAGGAWAVDVACAAGSHTLSALSRDAAGNETSSAGTLSLLVDTAAPTLSSVANTYDTNAADQSYLKSGSFLFTATVTNSGGGTQSGIQAVEFYKDTASTGLSNLVATDTSSAYEWTWDTSAQTEGTYYIKARALDVAGNVSTASVNTRYVDRTEPSVTLANTYGGSGQAYLKSGSFTFTATVTNTGTSPTAIRHVKFYKDTADAGTTNLVATDTAAAYAWAWSTTADAEGTYYLKAVACDNAGNLSAVSADRARYLDKTNPSVSVTAPAAGPVADTTLYTYADATDGTSVWKVAFFYDGASKGEDTASAYISPQYVDTSPLTEGSAHTLSATAYDPAGNTATNSVSVTVDNYAFSTVTLPDVGADSSAFGSENAIAADRTFDNIYIAYWDTAQNYIQLLRSSTQGATWNTTAADIAFKGRKPALAVDYGGAIHALYTEGSTLYYRKSTNLGSSWSTAAALATDASSLYAPAVAVYGTTTIYVHVAYITSATAPYTLKYRFSSNGGSSFGAAAEIQSTTNQIRYPKLASNGQGMYISWQDYAARRLYAAVRNNATGASLAGATAIGPTDVGEFQSAAALSYNDKFGTAHHSFLVTCADGASGGAFRYVYTTNGGTTWSDGVIAASMSFVQSDVVANAIGLAPNLSDVYHAAYYDSTTKNLLLGKSYNMSTWYSYTVDASANDVGSAPSAVSDGVTVYVAYYDATATRLKFAIATINF